MICPKCGCPNVTITSEQAGANTSVHKMGCLWGLCRLMLILCTCGLWLLVGKHKESGNTKMKYRTVAICQHCGYRWKV